MSKREIVCLDKDEYMKHLMLLISPLFLSACLEMENKKESINPQSLSLGSVTVHWTVDYFDIENKTFFPSEVESFSIKWGRTAESMTNTVDQIPPTSLSYVFRGLEKGQYAFAVRMNTIYGDQSEFSDVVIGVAE